MTDHQVICKDLPSLESNAVGIEDFCWYPSMNPSRSGERYMSPSTAGGSPSLPILTPSDLLMMHDSWDAPNQTDSPSTQCTRSHAATKPPFTTPETPIPTAVGVPKPATTVSNHAIAAGCVPLAGTATLSPCGSDVSLGHRMEFAVPIGGVPSVNPPSPFAHQCQVSELLSGPDSQNVFACLRWKDGPLDINDAAESEGADDDQSSHYLWSSGCVTYPTFGNGELMSSSVDESLTCPPKKQHHGGQPQHQDVQGTKDNNHQRVPDCSEDAIRSNLFISGLRHSVTDSGLHELFSPFGSIESAKVMLDIHTGRSRGIAFVKFVRLCDAQRAVEALNGSIFCGETITVRVAKPNAAYRPGAPTNKTFVRNVPLSAKKEDLVSHFSKYGQVVEVSIHGDTAQCSTNKKRNVVFITYTTKEAAAWAAQQTHTTMPFPDCEGIPLLAKVAEDSAHRIERLARRGSSGKQASNSSKAVSGDASPQTAHLPPTPPLAVSQQHPHQQSLLQFQQQQQQHDLQQQLFLQQQQQQQALQQQLFMQQQQQQQQAYTSGLISSKLPQAFGTCAGAPSLVMSPPGLYSSEPYTAPTPSFGVQQGLYATPLFPLPAGATAGGQVVILGPNRQLQPAVMCPPTPQPQSTVMYYMPGAQVPMQMPITAERLQHVTPTPTMRVG
ncbi:RNA-binding protein, putative [Trypanosoma brucei gambiense DAL972]|uniref:RNA-binding protein, putative n=1 Tax=Trypanosoma brucei gambiense (strain MHOM/CI/86/DAL972) TaxID=679716 RepID=C9ZWE9_TRYB9|nr:RNA-binding protein, putative [Trypanosoma brucei gambiense DAL972]CBH13738.1 RNA-binding protein, putative [Trypanosoma brucei gambiense DAL972]|eukprot:XP_011776014.1 RNA-binding protein, putative [Trypanosoma brucei gambiense DAL972]